MIGGNDRQSGSLYGDGLKFLRGGGSSDLSSIHHKVHHTAVGLPGIPADDNIRRASLQSDEYDTRLYIVYEYVYEYVLSHIHPLIHDTV